MECIAALLVLGIAFVGLQTASRVNVSRRNLRHKRYANQCCTRCGYDIRFNLDIKRCPECGDDLLVQAKRYWHERLD